MKNKAIFFCLIIALPALLPAQRITPAKAIKNIETVLKKAGAMRIHFKETYFWSLSGSEQSGQGDLLLEGEDRFRAVMQGQVLVSDGKTLWSHNIAEKQVVIDKLDARNDSMLPRRILFHYTRDYNPRIAGKEKVAGVACLKLIFTTSTGETMFPEVVVWVNEATWMIVQVKQKDLNDNTTTYRLEKVAVNQKFSKADFVLTIPEDCEVVDMR